MSKIALFTDIHLGVHQNSKAWLDVALKWSDWACSEIKKHDIDYVFFLGDLFHYRTEVALPVMDTAQTILDNLAESVKESIYMIPGNHDCYYKDNSSIHSMSLLKKHRRIHILDKYTVVDIDGVKMGFAPWGTSLEEMVDNPDVLFGHFDICGFKMNNSKVAEHGFEPANLAAVSKQIYTGHYHTQSVKNVGGSKISYIGNPFEQDFNDINDTKGIYTFSAADGKWEPADYIVNNVTPKHVRIVEGKDNIDPLVVKGNIIEYYVSGDLTYDEINTKYNLIKSYEPFALKPPVLMQGTKTAVNGADIITEQLSIPEAVDEYINNMTIEDDAVIQKVKDYTKHLISTL